MKSALSLCFAALALSGCAGGPAYWDHGEWLDRVSVRPQRIHPYTTQERQQLEAQAERLRTRRDAVRHEMALEPGRDRRLAQLRELEEIGDELGPVELALRGGPLPYRALPTEQPADAGGDGG
jgi:hypothetical protein